MVHFMECSLRPDPAAQENLHFLELCCHQVDTTKIIACQVVAPLLVTGTVALLAKLVFPGVAIPVIKDLSNRAVKSLIEWTTLSALYLLLFPYENVKKMLVLTLVALKILENERARR